MQKRTGAQSRPCPSAAAVARESSAGQMLGKCRPEDTGGPRLRTSRPSRTYQSAWQPIHLGAFNAVLPSAERRRGRTASPAAAPAQPLPAPRPALLSVSGSAPCPRLCPDASAQPPGSKWLLHLSVKDVLPGTSRRQHSVLPIKSTPLGWGST